MPGRGDPADNRNTAWGEWPNRRILVWFAYCPLGATNIEAPSPILIGEGAFLLNWIGVDYPHRFDGITCREPIAGERRSVVLYTCSDDGGLPGILSHQAPKQK